ncbi:hypothetical protein F4778DRAFT_782781 [Xylariomycetidae sp. FL2044]|nr:hypothetical protein F4778DRAFT_782781 [Xylariomycetidae sp. FL2044]
MTGKCTPNRQSSHPIPHCIPLESLITMPRYSEIPRSPLGSNDTIHVSANETRHGRLTRSPTAGASRIYCFQCNTPLEDDTQLAKHANTTKHRSYGCICGEKFTTLFALSRHLPKVPEFHCEYCQARTGEHGFKRCDHLRQHLRLYHKIHNDANLPSGRKHVVPVRSGNLSVEAQYLNHQSPTAAEHHCDYCDPSRAFEGHDALVQHLKDYHKMDTPDKLGLQENQAALATFTTYEASVPVMASVASPAITGTMGFDMPPADVPPFPCPYPYCDKFGYSGYVRQIDLDDHLVMMHYFFNPSAFEAPQFGQQMQQHQAVHHGFELFNFAAPGYYQQMQQTPVMMTDFEPSDSTAPGNDQGAQQQQQQQNVWPGGYQQNGYTYPEPY